jgi:2-polyprenyl-6-methoxyphenol hydroxylase-like FAD-dependent oxidoreductase
MLPQRTTFLIVGGGPTGLTAAIALAKQGIQDVVLVDAVLQGQNTSRAFVIHAATLEVHFPIFSIHWGVTHLLSRRSIPLVVLTR